ncbi:unnamed protein product [Symbiodinium sp. CCMP2592]|nr:unnamed protein product [Symbiodinium sp. CCMP2592]
MAKSSSSASKKQKLDHLDAFRRGFPFVSCSALAAILNKVEQEGVPELHGRKNIKQAVLEKIAAMAGDCGSLLKQLTAVRIDGLSEERHWFTLAVLRTELVQKVEADIGQTLGLILEDMFAQQLWNPVHGIVMKSTDALFVFHWTLHVFLQDGSAQKQTFANRHDIGSRVCMLCKNIFNVRREGDDDDEGKISSRHLTLSSCDLASDSEWLQSWDRLAAKAGTESKARFAMLQQASGWTFSPHALCMSSSNGVLSFVICWAFESWRNHGKTDVWESFAGYLELWQLPGANKQGSLSSLFSADKIKSHRKTGHLKCTASEVLGLLKPLQHYFTTCCLQEEVQPAKASLLAWLHVLELLNDQNQAPLRSRQLLLACEEALEKNAQAGWGPVMRPKFHWTLHLDGCYEKQGFLPACWVLEAARKYGSASSNTIRFDTSLLEEVTAEHLSVMGKEEGFHLRAHLLQPHACTAKLKKSLVQYNVLRQEDECMTSTMTRLKHGAIIKKGDMVLHGNEPACMHLGKHNPMFKHA